MEKKKIRICICCGQQYEYCVKCDDRKKETWKNNYDIASCRDVFNTISDYRLGYITKEVAADTLRIIPLEHRATYVQGVAEYVNELLGDVDKKARPEKDEINKKNEKDTQKKMETKLESKAEVKAETVDSILSHNKTDKIEKNTKKEYTFGKTTY